MEYRAATKSLGAAICACHYLGKIPIGDGAKLRVSVHGGVVSHEVVMEIGVTTSDLAGTSTDTTDFTVEDQVTLKFDLDTNAVSVKGRLDGNLEIPLFHVLQRTCGVETPLRIVSGYLDVVAIGTIALSSGNGLMGGLDPKVGIRLDALGGLAKVNQNIFPEFFQPGVAY